MPVDDAETLLRAAETLVRDGAAAQNLLAARWQMALSLGFHILFSVVGMAMPVLMVAAQALWLKTKDPAWDELARRWAKGTAILFGVGAVSGTLLSFELGLLWPQFMEVAGPLVGLPFSMEGYAFSFEAIFLGLYLYGREKLSPKVHLLCGVGVAVSGMASGVFVVAVNAWMNLPTGFVLDSAGHLQDLEPWKVFASPAFFTEALHMTGAAVLAVSVLVLGIHAARLLQDPYSRFHRAAVALAFAFVVVSAPFQLLSGDLSAKHLAHEQPQKLAAAEAHFHTRRGAPIVVGGIPDEDSATVQGGIEIPYVLSTIAFLDPNAEVKGLDQFPRKDWPNVKVVHVAFDVMVGCGMALLALMGFGVLLILRQRLKRTSGLASSWWAPLWHSKAFLWGATLCAPLGMLAVEAGWTVTEVGRQPWIIHGVLRTKDAVTTQPGLWTTLNLHIAIFVFLGVFVVVMLSRHVFGADAARDVGRRHAPHEGGRDDA